VSCERNFWSPLHSDPMRFEAAYSGIVGEKACPLLPALDDAPVEEVPHSHVLRQKTRERGHQRHDG
jgi:hypothetical protein